MKKVSFELMNLTDGLTKFLPLVNSHMVHVITHDLFENLLPKCVQEEILLLCIDELNSLVLDSFTQVKSRVEKAPNLTELLNQTRKLSLKQNDLCLPLEKFCAKLSSKGFSDCSFQITKHLMSVKKSHEVELMSSIIAAISNNNICSHIVDIGGGKGYLGSILALKYQLKVLSIDSSIIISKGAEKQMPRVQKLWSVLRKNSLQNDNNTVDKPSNDKVEQQPSQLCKLATLSITETTNILELTRENFKGDNVNGIMLVGLHTCGNLAASSLRLFSKNPDIGCVVNIGCCYHLIVEEFDTNPPWLETESQDSGVGFPMSDYLKGKRFVLGRNARMLAAHSPERISQEGTVQSEILFYRALLEVYLENKLKPSNGLPHFRVGKIARKCSSFSEYVNKSVKRLGLDIQVDEKELQDLYDNHQECRKKLHALFLLRLALAPAIEATVMLDRLLYLHEQGVEDAYLTQLFDPVVSPRCFAIVAFKKTPVVSDGPE